MPLPFTPPATPFATGTAVDIMNLRRSNVDDILPIYTAVPRPLSFVDFDDGYERFWRWGDIDDDTKSTVIVAFSGNIIDFGIEHNDRVGTITSVGNFHDTLTDHPIGRLPPPFLRH